MSQLSKLPLNQVEVLFSGQKFPEASLGQWMMVAGESAKLTEGQELSDAVRLGMQGVMAVSFDEHFRADLVKLGLMPLLFKFGMSQESLRMDGSEDLDFVYLTSRIKPGMDILCRMVRKNGEIEEFMLKLGVKTKQELAYFY